MTHPSEPGSWDPDDDDDEAHEGFDDDLDDELDLDGEPLGPVAKPDELLALHDVTAELFTTLRRWFDVPASVALDLAEVDSAVAELGDPQMVVALAMRKLQALHLLATPGVRTATDVVVAIVNDLERALVQAPNMWLKRRAATVDWDLAFAELEADDAAGPAEAGPLGPVDGDALDPEVGRFRELHRALHEAMFAVIEVSEGQIRELE